MFKIQQYGKSELALMYFPGASTSRGALSNLTYWIRCNRELSVALKECGMPVRSKTFTSKQVAIIIKYLGEP
ncbi:MAG: DUF4248 domain-containing protein [Bacteroidaceae bacterium]|jgi:hypothetical protein|nr:DUF4248 domain-containing protein [Bacteroidaceae bacterium]MBO4841245.1 DUF4248 domain-containing protein [Bacteroidaceae bacterium]